MSWDDGTWRKKPLPREWKKIRARVLKRDGHRCQGPFDGGDGSRLLSTPQCTAKATEVDHRDGFDDHSLSNLQSACTSCHRTKTNREAAAGRAAQRARRYRTREPHPGLISPRD